ncbi:MAG TPA: urea amidolyase associated protein UAAP1 [Solirubrobacteraceae bacterium]|jgi:hypothetical protein|nr:urea amidolyase associated protein UAAP1 [Solirubrobacteraceae bacterium]
MTGGTDTPAGARAHARAQAGAAVPGMPTLPASAWPAPPAGVAREALTWAETIPGGSYASKVLARGTTLRLTDVEGEACAHVLLHRADAVHERLNVADTVKVPWQAYLGAGHPLLSDQGRVLATIVADTDTGHDALCGTSTRVRNEQRYGDGSPHGPSPAGRELLLLAAAKHGLGPRDVPPSISFFKAVRVDPLAGTLRFAAAPAPGASVELRLEMDAIVLLANVPHPLDPRPDYVTGLLEVLAWRGRPTSPEDPLWSSTPELERGLLNTADVVGARP